MGLGFAERFLPWSEKNASKKLGNAIEKGNVKAIEEYLKRKPQKFEYLLWGAHPDHPGANVPLMAFGNPVALAQYLGRHGLVPMLVNAGYTNPLANQPNTTYGR